MPVDDVLDVTNDPSWRNEGRLFGKYRGVVKDNKDPLKLGRIQPTVPQVSGMTLNWAYPCAPYSGADVGFYTIPPIGAKVWIEFEGGNPNFPIWSGCFWQDGEVPTEMQENSDDPSQVKVFKTRVMTLWINDTDEKGKVVLQYKDPKISEPVTVKFTMDASGLEIQCQGNKGTSTITMTPQLISTESETLETTSTKNTTITAKENLTATAEKDMSHESKTSKVAIKAAQDVTVDGNNIKANAKINAEIKGNNQATLQGQSQAAVKGALVEVSATGINTIKGAMVKIN